MLYQPLPHEHCTRVLRIVEATAQQESKLTMTFTMLDLGKVEATTSADWRKLDSDDENDFDALSYTWGSPFSTPELKERYTESADVAVTMLSGSHCEIVKIGRNLYDALSQMWTSGRRRYLWADALCINQADLEEKSIQVQHMCDVYTKAKTTFVWFGVDDPDLPTFEHVATLTGTISSMLQHAIDTNTPFTIDLDTNGPDDGLMVVAKGSKEDDELRIPAERLQAWFRFFVRRRYFARAWVSQEVALATECIALLGNRCVQMQDLSVVMQIFDQYKHIMPLFHHHELGQETTGLGTELSGLSILSYRIKGWNQDTGVVKAFKTGLTFHYGAFNSTELYLAQLENILTTGHLPRCYMAVDMVYSLLGYLAALFPLKEYPIKVDYTKSVTEVYTTITATMLDVLPYHTVLSSVFERKLDRTVELPDYVHVLPSWVPDFNHCRGIADTIFGFANSALNTAHTDNHEDSAMRLPTFSAGLDGASYPKPRVDGFELSLHARRCARLISTCKPGVSSKGNNTVERGMYDQLCMVRGPMEMCLSCGPDRSEGHSLVEAMFHVLCLRTPLFGCTFKHDFSQICKVWLLMLLSMYENGTVPDDSETPAMKAKISSDFEHVIEMCEQLKEFGYTPSYEELAHFQTGFDKIIDGVELNDTERQLHDCHGEAHALLHLQEPATIFVTDNKYVGKVANRARPGDELWLICNAKVPFVLRPTADSKYTLLGEALVDEAMHGELVKNGIAGGPELIVIV